MSTSSLALALRIALLIEEHSEQEIVAAVELLERRGIGSALLEFLLYRRVRPDVKSASAPTEAHRHKRLQTTRLLRSLRKTDPDKSRMLAEFDELLRRRHVLSTFEDLKRFGERVSKDFRPRKSRKESIPALMAVLAGRSRTELEELIRFAATFGVGGDADEYQRLARFLIQGRGGER
jgi:hypothetical protein